MAKFSINQNYENLLSSRSELKVLAECVGFRLECINTCAPVQEEDNYFHLEKEREHKNVGKCSTAVDVTSADI